MFKKLKNKSIAFLIASIILHLTFWLGMGIKNFKSSHVEKERIEVTLVEPEISVPQQKANKQARKTPPKDQVVEQEKQINDQKPIDTRFLSKFDQVVKKETRADKTGAFTNAAVEGVQKAGEKEAPKDNKKPLLKEKGDLPSLKDLVPQFSLNPNAKEVVEGKAGDPSQSDDYVKDVEKGMQTLLSTREFVYYSYYQRIKESLRQYWEPTVKQKVKILYRKGRTIASAQDRITQIVITLTAQGELERVEVVGQSGVTDLDDAAIEAFKQAAPFPNPPKGIVEKDGRIRIRWDFILEANTRILKNRHFGRVAGM